MNLETHATEPNSDLGEAYGSVVNNRVRLSAFLRHPGVPLDTNVVERSRSSRSLARSDTAHGQ